MTIYIPFKYIKDGMTNESYSHYQECFINPALASCKRYQDYIDTKEWRYRIKLNIEPKRHYTSLFGFHGGPRRE